MATLVRSKPQRRKSRARRRMTYEQFLAAALPHNHFEWVDGEVVEMPAVENAHADMTEYLAYLLTSWLDSKDGGKIRQDPFQMHLSSRPSGRAPDIQVILTKSLNRLRKLYLDGPADVVIEVVSVGSRATDRRVKFTEYEQAGVPEYWIIDPLRKQAEFYVLEKKHFVPAPVDEEGGFHSRMLPGVWIDVNWLWDLPAKKQILKLWGV